MLFWNKFNFEIILFGLLSLSGLFYAIIRRTKVRLLISFWFVSIGTWLLIAAVYPHHFIQIIVPIACVSLLGFSDTLGTIKERFKKNIYVKNTLIFTLAVILFVPYVRQSASFFNAKRYPDPTYGAEGRFYVSQYINKHSASADKIFAWDAFDSGAIFLWSGRGNISKFHERYAFLPAELREYGVPYVKDYRLNQKQLLLDIYQNKPKYIAVVLDYKLIITESGEVTGQLKDLVSEREAFPEFFEILDKDYRLVKEVQTDQIQLYCLK